MEGFKIFYRVALGFIRVHHDMLLKCRNLGEFVMGVKQEVRFCYDSEKLMRRAFFAVGSMPMRKINRFAKRGEEEVQDMLAKINERRKE